MQITFTLRYSVLFLGLFMALFLGPGLLQPARAIVNMEALLFKKQQKGVSGDMSLLFSGSSGNSDTSNISFDAQLSWVRENTINLILLGYQYGKSNEVVSDDKSFVHFRHIHKMTSVTDWEAFTQFENNKFTRLSYRALLGGGLRFSVGGSETHHAFLGVGAFYSRENIEYRAGLTDDGTEELTRGNVYLMSHYQLKPTLKWSNVVYYQPSLGEFSDFRALLQSSFDFKINEHLNFSISLDINHDSQPAQSVKSTDTSYRSGLKWQF